MKFFRLFLLSIFITACSCGSSRNTLRIGFDPNWGYGDFGVQTSYINGYTEDVLLEMARYSGMDFELVKMSSDNLIDGLNRGKYDAIITSMPRREYNLAKYDFSENFLDTGPVLIISYNSSQNSLDKLGGDLVGIITNDPAELIIAKHPTIVARNYSSIPDLLNALALGEIQGALLDYIPAMSYVSDLYAGVLEVVEKPLNEEGIHFIGLKGGITAVNKNLSSLRKKSTLRKLKEKWELGF